MTHQEIENQEVIERFVRRQLSVEERRAFQAHYFECEECFERVEMTARFIAGVRDAARSGALAELASTESFAETSSWTRFFRPAMGGAFALALLLLGIIGWAWLRPSPPPSDLGQGKVPAPTASPANSPALRPDEPAKSASRQREEPKDLLAQNHPSPIPSANSPSVLLDSVRGDARGSAVTLPSGARSLTLRLEVDPEAPYTGYVFQILDAARRVVATGNAGKANGRGSLSATLPADAVQRGPHLVKCFGLREGQRELIGEYELLVQRP